MGRITEAYQSFARVYDLFMDNVPYGEWSRHVGGLLRESGCRDGILLDLACGTGVMTELLAEQGYDMIGVDMSEDMLNLALEKKLRSGRNILYLAQDMRELDLYGTVAGAVCLCDSLNYLLEPEDLRTVFERVNTYLDPGAPFIFDFNTEYKYRAVLGNRTIAENREDGSFIWENFYQEEERINEYDLTLFIKEEDGRFSRYEETHYQRAYTLEEIREALLTAGMEFVTVYDAFSKDAPRPDSERLCVVARERGKSHE
ncbi:MAG: class I SAM-dependent methyltransferase [Lachnospiraceae bacterium]|nr:class I SAM-dependent methyltransferase [Lachnospiraceae bacterium]